MKQNNLDLIVAFAKLWGITTADMRTSEEVYKELESYDSNDLATLFSSWAEEYTNEGCDDTCEFFERKMDDIVTPVKKTMFEKRYPVLYGYSAISIKKPLRNIQEVAEFIIEYGQKGDVAIHEEYGRLVLNTVGIYLNKVTDHEYMRELMKILAPMQKEVDGL